MVQIDVEVTEFFLRGKEVRAIVVIVEFAEMVAQVVHRIDSRPEAGADRGALHHRDGNARAQLQLAIFDHVVVDEPDKGLVAPLHPVKVTVFVVLKGVTVAIPGLHLDILAKAGRGPERRAVGEDADDAQKQNARENSSLPSVYCPYLHTPSLRFSR